MDCEVKEHLQQECLLTLDLICVCLGGPCLLYMGLVVVNAWSCSLRSLALHGLVGPVQIIPSEKATLPVGRIPAFWYLVVWVVSTILRFCSKARKEVSIPPPPPQLLLLDTSYRIRPVKIMRPMCVGPPDFLRLVCIAIFRCHMIKSPQCH